MKNIIIYDQTGRIYYCGAGDEAAPRGLPYIEVDVPHGKYVTGVDVGSGTAILADIPKSMEQLNAAAITDLQLAIAELAERMEG